MLFIANIILMTDPLDNELNQAVGKNVFRVAIHEGFIFHILRDKDYTVHSISTFIGDKINDLPEIDQGFSYQ
jgi:hypothetical protein